MRGFTGFLLACLALLALAAPAWAAPRPFELRDGQVVFTITIKGKQFPALLDTGATRSLIEQDLAKELGIRFQRVGGTFGSAGGRVAFGHTQQFSFDFGAGPVRRSMGTYPAGNTFAAEGVRILIGMDVLSAMAVSLNFEEMTIDVQRSTQFKAPDGEPMRLTDSGWRRYTLPVDLAGVQANLLLDTAASSSLHLDSDFVADVPVLQALPVSQRRRIAGIDGISEYDAIVLPFVGFGGQTFENVRASSGRLAHLELGSTDMDGVLGVDLLRRFNVVIDFGYRRAWLTPIRALRL